MKYFLPLMVIAICLFGCQKDKVTAPSVAGRWELRQEIGGSMGLDNSYPVGNGNVYQFNSDGTFMQYTADSLTAKGTYTVKAHAETVNSVGYNEIYFNGSANGQIVQVADSTLTLGITYDDGIANIYAKIP